MEAAVRRAWDRRITTAPNHRGGGPQAQVAGGGPEPRQEDAAGRALKKTLKPARPGGQSGAVRISAALGAPASGRMACEQDFVSDQLVGGQRFRLLTLVDNHSRESLAIEVGQRLTGDDDVRILEGVASRRGKPQTIRVDNGPEFISRSLDLWASFNGVNLDFSRPGKPTDNAFIESFNGRLHVECLNRHWFLSLDEARAVTEAWRDDYNRVRTHGALGNRTPSEFARLVDGHAHLPALHG